MKELDLMFALNELDDELLERETGTKIRRFRVTKVAAIAAVLALMTVTVFAAVIGIQYGFDEDYGNLPVARFHYSFSYEDVGIREEAYEELSQCFNSCWEQWGIPELEEDADAFFYVGYNGDSLNVKFSSIEEIEEYLGIDLLTSPEMDAIINQNLSEEPLEGYLITLRGATSDIAYAEYQETGRIPLLGIDFHLPIYDETVNANQGLVITIPLDECYMEYYPENWLDEFGPEGSFLLEEYSNDSLGFLIAEVPYTDANGGMCAILYAENGICYKVDSRVWPADAELSAFDYPLQNPEIEFCYDARSVIQPLIENIE